MHKMLPVFILISVLCLFTAACGGKEEETVTLKVAASPTPHAEILEQCAPILAEQGIELVITAYGYYLMPNLTVESGDEDACFFQHRLYLEAFNREYDTHLTAVADIHTERMGIYAGKTTSLDALPDSASVAVPNDTVNHTRALRLLERQGLIELTASGDIAANPNNLVFTELEAAMIPTALTETDIAVINGNYALQHGLSLMGDALAVEAVDSSYANVLAVRKGRETEPAIAALAKALQSEAVRSFMRETYGNTVTPAF